MRKAAIDGTNRYSPPCRRRRARHDSARQERTESFARFLRFPDDPHHEESLVERLVVAAAEPGNTSPWISALRHAPLSSLTMSSSRRRLSRS
jgi:hypothetical protein